MLFITLNISLKLTLFYCSTSVNQSPDAYSWAAWPCPDRLNPHLAETTNQKHIFCCILFSLSLNTHLETSVPQDWRQTSASIHATTTTYSYVHPVSYIIMGCNMHQALLYIAIHPQDHSGEVVMTTLILSSIDKKCILINI